MVARRKATTSTARAATQQVCQQPVSDGVDDDAPVAGELAHLHAMRDDVRAWLAGIEQRIMELEQVVFTPADEVE